MTRETFNANYVEDLKSALKEAPAAPGKLSKAQVLRALAPDLKQLREEKNYTLEQLVDLLAKQGLKVTVSTLQSAFKKKATPKKAKPIQAPAANLRFTSNAVPIRVPEGVISGENTNGDQVPDRHVKHAKKVT